VLPRYVNAIARMPHIDPSTSPGFLPYVYGCKVKQYERDEAARTHTYTKRLLQLVFVSSETANAKWVRDGNMERCYCARRRNRGSDTEVDADKDIIGERDTDEWRLVQHC
jgi:hypothetical protein